MTLVVSLSTIPSRFDKLTPVLESLLLQRVRAEEVRLYVPKRYRRFPDYDGTLPRVPRGVRVIQVEEDLGPATKVLFAAQDLQASDTDIIYCDDDRLYPRWWFEGMLRQRGRRKDHCVATSTIELANLGYAFTNPRSPRPHLSFTNRRRIYGLARRKVKQALTGVTDRKQPLNRTMWRGGYVDIAEGCGAVLVRPDFFDELAFDIPPILWSVDDYWLSGHLERKGIPIWATRGYFVAPYAEHTRIEALYDAVIDGARRDAANHACVKYMQETYGIWL